jgi:hypothetical protein
MPTPFTSAHIGADKKDNKKQWSILVQNLLPVTRKVSQA